MNVGVSIPLPAYHVDPAFIARTAEALGFESLWCAEHPIMPVRSKRCACGSSGGAACGAGGRDGLGTGRGGGGAGGVDVAFAHTIGPKVWLTPGSISVAVDRLENAALVKRKNTDDRRVRLVGLTAKGRALITKTFREHAAAMEEAAGVLSKAERRMLLRLLRKLGKGGEDES